MLFKKESIRYVMALFLIPIDSNALTGGERASRGESPRGQNGHLNP
jgi:hypothetical protein